MRSILILLAFGVSLSVLSPTAVWADDPVQASKPLRVCMVSASPEYESDRVLKTLQEFIEQKYKHVEFTWVSTDVPRSDSLPGLEKLADCDVMLLYTWRLNLKGDELKMLQDYCNSGKPIVGVRTASHAVQTWLELDPEVLGGSYTGHYGANRDMQMHIVEDQKDHPILTKVTPYVARGSLYKNFDNAADINILMYGSIDTGEKQPVTWTRTHNGGRVFYTSLGHQTDFEQPDFLQLLSNALHWAAKKTPEAK